MLCSPSPEGGRRCVCKVGWVGWKWECLPRAGLGEECTSSHQCQKDQREKEQSQMCSPVSHTCSCAPGFNPSPPSTSHSGPLCLKQQQVRLQEAAKSYQGDTRVDKDAQLAVTDDVIPVFVPLKQLATPKRIPSFGDSNHLIKKALEATLERHKETRNEKERGAYQLIRSAVKSVLNSTSTHQKPDEPNRSDDKAQDIDKEADVNEIRIYWRKGDTVLLVGCLCLCLGVACILTFFYLRAVQDKKVSQAALQTLIQFLSEKENQQGGGSIEVKPSTDGKDNFADRVNTPTETFDYAILGPSRDALPSRLTLAPLEGDSIIRLPPPQSCHAPLPGIAPRKPARKERRKYQQLNPRELKEGNPAADTLRQMFQPPEQEDRPPKYEELLN